MRLFRFREGGKVARPKSWAGLRPEARTLSRLGVYLHSMVALTHGVSTCMDSTTPPADNPQDSKSGSRIITQAVPSPRPYNREWTPRRYIQADRDMSLAHDAICLTDMAHMMKMNRDAIRADRVKHDGDVEIPEEEDVNIHIGDEVHNVQDYERKATPTSGTPPDPAPPVEPPVQPPPAPAAARKLWPLALGAAMAGALPPTAVGLYSYFNRPTLKDTDTQNTIRPYDGDKIASSS